MITLLILLVLDMVCQSLFQKPLSLHWGLDIGLSCIINQVCLESTYPPLSAVNYAHDCNAIICSRLQRSIDSATILNAGKIVLCDDLFIEAGLPSASWHTFKMTPKFWAICFRVLWLLGYSHHSESIKEVKARAALATDKLIELATQHHKVLFVGHGIFNRFLVKELIRRGWSGAKSPQSEYWAGGLYKKSYSRAS